MPRKQSKEDRDYKEGVTQYNEWNKMNKKFEKQGFHGADYYVKRVEQLEATVKRLEAIIKTKGKK